MYNKQCSTGKQYGWPLEVQIVFM